MLDDHQAVSSDGGVSSSTGVAVAPRPAGKREALGMVAQVCLVNATARDYGGGDMFPKSLRSPVPIEEVGSAWDNGGGAIRLGCLPGFDITEPNEKRRLPSIAPRRAAMVVGLAAIIGMFGSTALAETVELSDIARGDGSQGFAVTWHSAKAGDVNGDGVDDVLVGGPACTSATDICTFVVFGPTEGLAATVPNSYLQALDGTKGFRIAGAAPFDQTYMDAAGDVNGDGVDDIIVSNRFTGGTYVIFGSHSGFPGVIDANQLNGTNGFRINREACDINLGWPVRGLGDINGDGVADVAIQSFCSEVWLGRLYRSWGYVVYGHTGWSAPSIDLAGLDGSNGFRIFAFNEGTDAATYGLRLNAAGDVNGDGVRDLIIGNPGGDQTHEYPPLDLPSGQAYVVFGSTSFPAAFYVPDELGISLGVRGFTIDGNPNLGIATSVSGAGDVNGDGVDDVIAGGGKIAYAFVVYGSRGAVPASVNVDDLNGANGFKIKGAGIEFSNQAVSNAGDFNGDDIADVIVARGSPSGNDGGVAYVVFGNPLGFAATVDLADLDPSTGLVIESSLPAVVDMVGALGDVNGDTIDDVGINASGFAMRAGFVVYGFGTPEKLLAGLIGRVESLALPHGTEQSLLAKLNLAQRKLPGAATLKAAVAAPSNSAQGNPVVAINALGAFIREVEAQYGKKISAANADWLIARAEQIVARLSN